MALQTTDPAVVHTYIGAAGLAWSEECCCPSVGCEGTTAVGLHGWDQGDPEAVPYVPDYKFAAWVNGASLPNAPDTVKIKIEYQGVVDSYTAHVVTASEVALYGVWGPMSNMVAGEDWFTGPQTWDNDPDSVRLVTNAIARWFYGDLVGDTQLFCTDPYQDPPMPCWLLGG